jgi:hypothetical protein
VVHGLRTLGLASGALLLSACARSHLESGSTEAHPDQPSGAAGTHAAAGGMNGGTTEPTLATPLAPGGKATARLEPVVERAPDAGTAVDGVANFTVTTDGVDLLVMLNHCSTTAATQLVIQAGSDCSGDTLTGAHWRAGQGIPDVNCLGVIGAGRDVFSRARDDTTPWTIGGPTTSDVVGHALVAYDAASGEALACGVIALDDSAPPAPAADAGATDVSLLGRAQIAGLCLSKSIARNNTQQCPDPKALSACAQEHCQLDDCVATCADYLACTTTADDPCSVEFTCKIDTACSKCYGAVQMCALSFCGDQVACAAPTTEGGSCSQLEACCALQGDMEQSCLELVHSIEKLSGDPSCFGVMNDQQFVSHLMVPCTFK